MTEGRLSDLWCDGFIREGYLIHDEVPKITGSVWICTARGFEEWRFELLLIRPVEHIDDINWTELLPAENVTRWLAVDKQRKRIQIEPAAAVPDLP